jgi:hypothetical protein
VNATRLALLLALLIGSTASISMDARGAGGQDQDEADTVRAGELVRQAIRARGGDAYLNIKEAVSKGEFTPFQKGASTLPMNFLDYVVYPDKERTEFGKGGSRTVQTNMGNTGWVYQAETKLIKDQTEQQIKDYQQGARYDLDTLLRRGWKEPGAKLVYLGRREPWKDTFSEAVRIEFSDGASATIHFDTRTKFPMAVEFKALTDNGPKNEQVRYYQWIDYDGVKFPKVQDTYREGIQTSRVYYDSIIFNATIPPRVFEKPASPKEVK